MKFGSNVDKIIPFKGMNQMGHVTQFLLTFTWNEVFENLAATFMRSAVTLLVNLLGARIWIFISVPKKKHAHLGPVPPTSVRKLILG